MSVFSFREYPPSLALLFFEFHQKMALLPRLRLRRAAMRAPVVVTRLCLWLRKVGIK
jgi:hypothetical protein